MELRDKIKTVLREQYGDFTTNLEHQYEDRLVEVLLGGEMKDKQAWVTYNQVVLEFKNTLKDTLLVQKLQYKLTDDIDPNDVCIEIIKDIKSTTPELERLYNKIKNF